MCRDAWAAAAWIRPSEISSVNAGGIDVDVSIELAYEQGSAHARLASELEIALYRMTQEALTNATKHGHASRAVVEISEDSDSVQLLIRDNGSGFDPHAKSEGFGLLGITERVALLHGELDIESAPGAGTTIRARLPVRRASAEQQLASA